jgi:RHS repeat-associated protein
MRRTIHLIHPLIAAVVLNVGLAAPAQAQGCDPRQTACPPSPPSVTVTPGTLRTDSLAITVRVHWRDGDGLFGSNYRILVNGSVASMQSWGFSQDETGTMATSEARVTTRRDAMNTPTVVTAEITDREGNFDSNTATYTYAGEEARIARDTLRISMEPFHNAFRDLAAGSASLSYAMPSYVSMGQARSYGALYLSEQAYQTGYVQVDVTDLSLDAAPVYSLQVIDFATGARVTLQNGQQEMFFSRPSLSPTRLAGQWDMRTKPTGDYKYWVVARAHWADGTVKESRSLARVLVVNEVDSPFGRGWSMPGLHRIFPGTYGDGVLLSDGAGKVLFFEAGACHEDRCTYRSPEGDFSTLERNQSTGAYTRRYGDGSKITYYAFGGIEAVEDRFGNRTAYAWAFRTKWVPTAITDPAGKVVTFHFNDGGCGGCQIAGFIDPAQRTTTVFYNTAGQVTAVTAPDGSYVFRDVTYGGASSTANLVTGWTDARGGQWNFTMARSHLQDVYAPSVMMNGVAVRPRTGLRSPQTASMRFDVNTSFAVPARGMWRDSALVRFADAEGHVSWALLDRFGNQTYSQSPTGARSYSQYDTRGLPLQTVSAAGIITINAWSDEGLLLEQRTSGQSTFRATYTYFGQPRSTTRGGQTTWYSYDTTGRLVRSWTGTGLEADSLQKATSYTFDARGRLTAVAPPDGLRSETQYSASGWMNPEWTRVLQKASGTTQWVTTTFAYDGYGRTSGVQGPDGATATEYDLLNRSVKVTDARGGITTFGYTGPDLTRVTDAANKSYTWSYDVLGLLAAETDPEGRSRTYVHNKDGMVTSRTDRRGQTVATTYYADHRIRQVTADGQTTTYSYSVDPYRVVATNAVSTDTLEQHLMYPWLTGRKVHVMGGRQYVIRSIVDDASQTSNGIDVTGYVNGVWQWQRTAPIVRDFTPADPALGYEVKYANFTTTVVTQGYDKTGRLTRTSYPNGVTRYHGYDDHRRPAGISFNSTPVNSALAATYDYDAMGRLERRRPFVGDSAHVYDYDELGRLSSMAAVRYTLQQPIGCDPSYEYCPAPDTVVTPVRTESFSYDAVGNRTDRPATLAASSNRYTSFDGWTLEYDAEGNLRHKYKAGVMDQWFTWNALGQLAEVTTNGRRVTYGYNGFGTRVKREDAHWGSTVWSLYDGDDLLIEMNAAGEPIRSYTYADGTDVPLSMTMGSTGETFYYVTESPGHVRALLSSSGAVVQKYTYRPFGQQDAPLNEGDQPLQFMARERDGVTGIYYVRARWYDADLGRFVSEDPIGLNGGINTYAYANNDPINLRDPSGLDPFVDCTRYKEGTSNATILWCWSEYGSKIEQARVRWSDHMQLPGSHLLEPTPLMLSETSQWALRNPNAYLARERAHEIEIQGNFEACTMHNRDAINNWHKANAGLWVVSWAKEGAIGKPVEAAAVARGAAFSASFSAGLELGNLANRSYCRDMVEAAGSRYK